MAEVGQKTKKRLKRFLTVLGAFLLFVASVLGVLQLGCVYTEKSWEHWYPTYEKVDITPLLSKAELTEEDYELLYRQTGLTKLAIDDMRPTVSGRGRIVSIQNQFFTKVTPTSRNINIFTYIEEVDGYMPLCELKDGDIIVSATTRVSWWRYGHAAIVVDGGRGLIAEAISIGVNSSISTAASFCNLADFLVLRPKVDEETKGEVVAYVNENLIGLPYRFSVGLLSKKYPSRVEGTQCAHLVWYAYRKFGVDLDSNGGWLVKPQDMACSSKVDVVQAYGFDLDRLWS